jgi:hypothetical protein
METIEYHTKDKSQWGKGPWLHEPDKKQWQDPATGLPCLIVRNNSGALCGYVGLPPGHKFYGWNYDDVDVPSPHGGLTYSDFCQHSAESHGICHRPGEGEPDTVWWLGFDCAHGGDYLPAASYRRSIPGSYRDLNYVTQEITQLAAELAK